jgi:hypothetical protein
MSTGRLGQWFERGITALMACGPLASLIGVAIGSFLGIAIVKGFWFAALVSTALLVLAALAWIAHDEMRRARASADAEACTIFEEALRHAQDRAGKS